MPDFTTAAQTVAAVMMLIAWVLEKLPPLKAQWDRLSPGAKQWGIVAINLAVVIGLTLYGCRITVGITAECVTADLWATVIGFLGLNGIGLGASQGAHMVAKRKT